MVQINFAQKQVKAKVVYYGPGMSGKTTNLEVVHQRAPDTNRGDLTSISTDGDRTLFFDYMPLDLGTVAGMKTSFQIYTVPGQVYYNSTRKLVLQGVDGVVFVADSSASMVEENLESLRNLEENLQEYGKSLATLPHVIQFNKRDLPDALPVEEMERMLNKHGAPTYEGIANTGQGVFPTLKALASCVLKNIMQERSTTGAPTAPAPAAAAPAGMAGAPAPAGAPMAPAPAAPTGGAPAPAAPGYQAAAATAPQAAPQAGAQPGNLMQQAPPQPVQRPRARAASGAGRPQGQAQAQANKKKQATRTATPAAPQRSKMSVAFTVGFVVVAMAVGALLAGVVMKAL